MAVGNLKKTISAQAKLLHKNLVKGAMEKKNGASALYYPLGPVFHAKS